MTLSGVYILTILIGISGSLHLICISLLNDDVYHLSICLFAIGISSLVECSDLMPNFFNCAIFLFLCFEILYKSFIFSSSLSWKRL